MLTLDQALEETRTGDLWLFRGRSRPDRAIQTLTNSPVNHVGMTVAIDDLPPLIWHAELGDKLIDMWTGTNHRGVQLHDLRQAVLQWTERYHQRCWLRQLTPYATREQEDKLLRVIARMDGTAFPTTARLTGRWFRGRLPTINDWVRGIPLVDRKVREQTQRRKGRTQMGLETAYCAETVAITYEEMGLLVTDKDSNWFDPGSFWSGDTLPLAPGYQLGDEIAVSVGQVGLASRSVDRHLPHLRPPCRVDRLTDDLGRGRQRLRQLPHRPLEVIAVDMDAARVTVAESLDQDVLSRVVQAARPLEPQVARFGTGGRGERGDQFRPAVGPLGFGFELDDDEDHCRSPLCSQLR